MKYKNSTRVWQDVERDIAIQLSKELQEEIDREIVQGLVFEMKAKEIVDKQKKEELLRSVNPALQKAWEEYQVVLRLVQSEFSDPLEVNT